MRYSSAFRRFEQPSFLAFVLEIFDPHGYFFMLMPRSDKFSASVYFKEKISDDEQQEKHIIFSADGFILGESQGFSITMGFVISYVKLV